MGWWRGMEEGWQDVSFIIRPVSRGADPGGPGSQWAASWLRSHRLKPVMMETVTLSNVSTLPIRFRDHCCSKRSFSPFSYRNLLDDTGFKNICSKCFVICQSDKQYPSQGLRLVIRLTPLPSLLPVVPFLHLNFESYCLAFTKTNTIIYDAELFAIG